MTDTTTHHIAGVILAGGNARRMGGIPKGTVRVDGQLSLLERLVVPMLRCGVEEIVVVANDERPDDLDTWLVKQGSLGRRDDRD